MGSLKDLSNLCDIIVSDREKLPANKGNENDSLKRVITFTKSDDAIVKKPKVIVLQGNAIAAPATPAATPQTTYIDTVSTAALLATLRAGVEKHKKNHDTSLIELRKAEEKHKELSAPYKEAKQKLAAALADIHKKMLLKIDRALTQQKQFEDEMNQLQE